MPATQDRLSVRPTLPGTAAWMFSLALLLGLSQYNYVIFHSAAETLTISIAVGIFVLAWYSRKRMDHDFILYMGLALLFYAIISFFHMMTFKGMGIVVDGGNISISLTIATRYLIALSLLTGAVFIKRRLWVQLTFAIYTVITLLVLLSIFVWGNFPASYIDGSGVTEFKTALNLGTLPLLAIALLRLCRYRDRFDDRVFRLLAVAVLMHACANVSFSFYGDVYGIQNLVGHIFQVTAFYLMFMAVVDVGLTRPQDILFRRTKESEAVAIRATKHLEQVVEERTADLERAKQAAEYAALQVKTITDTAADAVICIDGEMKVVFWNRGAEKIFGYTSDEAMGMMCRDFIPEGNLEDHAKVLAYMGDAEEEFVPGGSMLVDAIQDGGTTIPVEIALSFWSQSGKRFATLVARDQTDRLKIEHELRKSAEQIAGVLRSVIETMGSAVEARDPYTQGHQRGVARVSVQIAQEMGLAEQQVADIEIAALVHDIGKLAVPATILGKPGRLSEVEYEMVQDHPRAGFEILRHIDFGAPIAEIVLQHHERMDGSGYPYGLTAESIFLPSRVLAVADVIEAMCSIRPYRPSRTIEDAMDEIRQNRVCYDSAVLLACERLYESGALSESLCSKG